MLPKVLTKRMIMEMMAERQATLARLHYEMKADQDFDEWSATYQSGIGDKYLKGLPEGFVAKYTPIGKIGVDIGLNNVIVGERPSITARVPKALHRETPAGKQLAKEQTTYLNQCLAGLSYALDTYSIETPRRDFVRKAIALGVGFLAYRLDRDRWDDPPFGISKGGKNAGKPFQGRSAKERAEFRKWEMQRKRTIPFRIQSVHPRNVLFDVNHDPPDDYIIVEDIQRGAAARAYPDLGIQSIAELAAVAGSQPAGLHAGSTVRRISYYSAEKYAIYIDDKPLLTAKDGANEEGIAPNVGVPMHRMALGGFGDKDHEGNWEHRIAGIIRNSKDVIIRKIVLQNIKDAIAQTGAFPVFEREAENLTQIELESTPFRNGPGAVWDHTHNVKGAFMMPPPIPPWIVEMENVVDRELEIIYGPEINRGIREPNETAAGQAERAAIAQLPYRAAKYACQQAEAAMWQDICYLIKHELQEPIWVPGPSGPIRFDPDMIPDDLIIEVDYSPATESEKALRRAAFVDDLRLGVLSRDDYLRETQGIEDAEDKLVEIDGDNLARAMLSMPEFQAMLMQQFLTQRGLSAPAAPGPGQGPPPGQPPPAEPLSPTGPAEPPFGGAEYQQQPAAAAIPQPQSGFPVGAYGG